MGNKIPPVRQSALKPEPVSQLDQISLSSYDPRPTVGLCQMNVASCLSACDRADEPKISSKAAPPVSLLKLVSGGDLRRCWYRCAPDVAEQRRGPGVKRDIRPSALDVECGRWSHHSRRLCQLCCRSRTVARLRSGPMRAVPAGK